MAKREKMLTAVFRDRHDANLSYEWLQDHGYRSDEINVLMSDRTRRILNEQDAEEGRIKSGTMATEGMAAGGAIGTAVGATIAAIAAIGTTVLIPGVGWAVAGPLAAALAGGGAGAVTGGALGALIGLGIPESNAKAYEQALKEGGIVIGVVPHTSDETKTIREYFDNHHGENIISI